MIRRFARPYARAFMEVVPTPAGAQTVHDELRNFETVRAGSSELAQAFASPSVEAGARQNLGRAIATRLQLSDLAVRIVEVLVRNHRINDLGTILDAWQAMIHQSTGVAVAEVRTAHELQPEEKDILRQSLERRFGRKIELRLSTDPSLLGGFVAQIESEVYDASVNGQLGRIRNTLQ
jgi:F-type H+-transporting ATPase subunit delta